MGPFVSVDTYMGGVPEGNRQALHSLDTLDSLSIPQAAYSNSQLPTPQECT